MLAVRAEIKLWEKSFRLANGRDPTVDDIKAHPSIADKYKLYKRLSKQAAATPVPSTPPKKSTLLPSVSRAAESTAPLATFNPFSPVKNKGKDRAPVPQHVIFSTPTKPNPSRLLLNSPSEPSSSKQPAVPLSPVFKTSAISKARKRLRGEPVSPSPNKDKRQRVSSHPKLPAPSLDLGPVTGSTIIGESPVKQPAGNRSFTILFEESLPPLVLGPKESVQTVGSVSEQPLPSFDEELGWLKNSHVLRNKPKRHLHVHKTRVTQEVPKEASTSSAGNGQEPFRSAKRSLLEMESDDAPTLIPPSPPPETDPSYTRRSKAQMKSRMTASSRKKVKTSNSGPSEDGSSEESVGDLQFKVKVVNAVASRLQGHRGDSDWDEKFELDSDPILSYTLRPKTHSPRGFQSPLEESPSQSRTGMGSKIEVDLPDKLRDVLALDAVDMEARDKHAERVVEELLYNRRTVRYDPDKGGEIWDIGEDAKLTRIRWDGEILLDAGGEEDWEGEPVPWEVAEL